MQKNILNVEEFKIKNWHYQIRLIIFLFLMQLPILILILMIYINLLFLIFSIFLIILFFGFGLSLLYKKVEIYISDNMIKLVINKNLYFQVNWHEIKEIFINKESYERKSPMPFTGYKIELIGLTEVRSIRPFIAGFSQKQENKIIQHLEYFANIHSKILIRKDFSDNIIPKADQIKLKSEIDSFKRLKKNKTLTLEREDLLPLLKQKELFYQKVLEYRINSKKILKIFDGLGMGTEQNSIIIDTFDKLLSPRYKSFCIYKSELYIKISDFNFTLIDLDFYNSKNIIIENCIFKNCKIGACSNIHINNCNFEELLILVQIDNIQIEKSNIKKLSLSYCVENHIKNSKVDFLIIKNSRGNFFEKNNIPSKYTDPRKINIILPEKRKMKFLRISVSILAILIGTSIFGFLFYLSILSIINDKDWFIFIMIYIVFLIVSVPFIIGILLEIFLVPHLVQKYKIKDLERYPLNKIS